MRCKKHLSDISSDVGVCGSCLRERLLFAIQLQTPPSDSRKQVPAPKIFPRSVSPYVKSDATRDAELSDEIRKRYFRTPEAVSTVNKKKKSKFHAISKLFRSRSTKPAQSTLDPSSNSSRVLHSSTVNRGMSPDGGSGYSYKKSPVSGRSNVASGIGICLSPLMRPSPCPSRHRREAAYSSTVNPHLSNAASTRANRRVL